MSNTNYPPIDLESAKQVTEKWRDTYAGFLQLTESDRGNDPSVFRGFTIPLSDLTNILAVFGDYNKNRGSEDGEIDGVRIYLAKGEVQGIPQTADGKIHILVVPASGVSLHQSVSPGERITTDILHDLHGKSLIYDFTSPCPELCDRGSHLYKKF